MPETMAPAFAATLLESLHVTSDCTVCGLCESVAPEVFRVTETGCVLLGGDWERYDENVRLAQRLCPSGAIRID